MITLDVGTFSANVRFLFISSPNIFVHMYEEKRVFYSIMVDVL